MRIESWKSEIKEFKYLGIEFTKADFEITRTSEDTQYNCYNAGIRLCLDSEDEMLKSYYEIIEKFGNGEKVMEKESVEDDFMKMKMYKFGGKLKLPIVTFSASKGLGNNQEYILMIGYMNCLSIPKMGMD